MTAQTALAPMGAETAGDRDGMTVLEDLLLKGDLAKLAPRQRLTYYHDLCKSLGLNPFTRPFEYLLLKGKLVLYAKKDAAEQLRKIHSVSIVGLEVFYRDGLVEAVATARDKTGRTDQDLGSVAAGTAKGEDLANIRKKAVTQAKRRVTLSICGLGMLDETEVAGIPDAQVVDAATVETETPTAAAPDGPYWGEHARALATPSLARKREQVAQMLTEQPDALTKLPKPVEELTEEEADKTLTWLHNRVRAQEQAQADSASRPAPIEGEYTEQAAAGIAEPETPEQPAPMDGGRRAALNRFVDTVAAMTDALTRTRGPLKGDQIEGLSLMYEQGQVLVRGRLETQADSVKPTELIGLISVLRDTAIDELRAGEAPQGDEDEVAF